MSDIPTPPEPPMAPPPMAPPFAPNSFQQNKKALMQTFTDQISSGHKIKATQSNSVWQGLQEEKYFSEKKCKFVGLSNQGATCYMNSLIQSLFMTFELRKLLYCWRYNSSEDGPKSECIPYQLQRLFARMQVSERSYVDTADLTKSFGWNEHDAFQQHDVQELLRVLLEALEKCFLRTEFVQSAKTLVLEGLYRGYVEDYLECIQCHSRRAQLLPFFDIQLAIQTVDSVEQALMAYITPEVLDKDNRVSCGTCNSKQDHLKGMTLKEAPYLLCLQLKRFDFDWQTLQRVKINSRCSFPLELDMKPYVTEGSIFLYDLFAILVASGGAMGGHYFTYIRNFEDSKWYNFDDTVVRELENPDKEIERMFGGGVVEESSTESVNKPQTKKGHGTNAYMLIYRQKSDVNANSVSNNDIPAEMLEEIYKENEEFLKGKVKFLEKKESYTLRIVYGDQSPKNIVLHREKTLLEATQLAYSTLFPEGTLSPDCYRLRDFNSTKKTPGQTYTGREKQTLLSLDFFQNKLLLLETREPSDTFPPDDNWTFKVFYVPPSRKYNEVEPIQLSVKPQSSLIELKIQIAQQFSLETGLLLLSRIHNGQTVEFLFEKENGTLQTDYALVDGLDLYVECCDGPDQSLISKQVEESQNLISISFNKPGDQNWEHELTIDKRKSLMELKERISEVLKLDVNSFKLCRNLIKHEYKNLAQSCDDVGLFDNSAVLIEIGTPLTVTQFKIKFLTYQMEKHDPWAELATHVIDVGMTMGEVKQLIAAQLDVKDLGLIRLRDKQGAKAANVLDDSKTLKACFLKHLYDGKEIAVQLLASDQMESYAKGSNLQDKLLIEVQRWSPSKWEFGSKIELALPHECSVAELRRVIANKFDLPFEIVLIGKPRPFQLRDLSLIPLLAWEVDDCCLLSDSPWHVQDGDLILFKDRLEQEKVDLQELIKQKEALGQTLSSSDYSTQRSKVPEPSIKIHTRYDKNYVSPSEKKE